MFHFEIFQLLTCYFGLFKLLESIYIHVRVGNEMYSVSIHISHLTEPKQVHMSFVMWFSRHSTNDTGLTHFFFLFHFAHDMGVSVFFWYVRIAPCHMHFKWLFFQEVLVGEVLQTKLRNTSCQMRFVIQARHPPNPKFQWFFGHALKNQRCAHASFESELIMKLATFRPPLQTLRFQRMILSVPKPRKHFRVTFSDLGNYQFECNSGS